MGGVFISYRRDDSGVETRRLGDLLAVRFGSERVFVDVVTLTPGMDFAEVIDEKVGFCDALVAVIGPRWLDSRDAGGQRRLDDPRDWVRLEIVAALSRGITVIPALVGEARLPKAGQLPPALAALAGRQAIDLRPQRFLEDVDRLGVALDHIIGGRATASWLSLLTRRHRALDPLDLDKPSVLWRALRFLILMLAIGELLRLPAAAQAGIEYWNLGYAVAYVLAGCVEWLALGVALHLAMRAVGGRASLRKSVVVICFMAGAWLPLIALSQAPVWGLNISVLRDMTDVGWNPATAGQKMTAFVNALGAYGVLRVVASFLAATALWLILLTSVFAAFRTLHRLDRGCAVGAFVLGVAADLAFVGLVLGPLFGNVYHAAGIPSR